MIYHLLWKFQLILQKISKIVLKIYLLIEETIIYGLFWKATRRISQPIIKKFKYD